MPWAYVRDVIARRYNVLPTAIDDLPQDEVKTILRIMSLEAEAT